MYFIVYSSKAADHMDEDSLKQILDSSGRNNENNNITGMLIFRNDTFIQMLEGKQADVEATFNRILEDKRHEQVLKLFANNTDKRHFPNWKMAMQVVDDATFSQIENYQPLEEGDRFLSELNDDHIGLKMLSYFYEMQKNN